MVYAIVRAGGRQEKVAVGDVLEIDRLQAEPADVTHYDLRGEWFFGNGDNFTVTFYYKDLENPIEFFESPASDTTTAREILNAESAEIKGVELEGLKGLSFLGGFFDTLFIQGNLTRLSRLLRILRFHAHDLNLVPSWTAYVHWGKGPKQRLRFTKTGEPKLEKVYATHFVWPGKGPFHPPAAKRAVASPEHPHVSHLPLPEKATASAVCSSSARACSKRATVGFHSRW